MNKRPTNDVIREIFLKNGFKIPPELTDMRPYVYEAARELLRYYGVWINEPMVKKAAKEKSKCICTAGFACRVCHPEYFKEATIEKTE